MKIKLVLQPNQFTSFTSYYLEPLWREYFDIELHDESKTYNPSTLFVCLNNDDLVAGKLLDQGHKVVIDNLWENHSADFDRFYQLSNPNWWWWNESLWWKSRKYDQYVPNKTYKKIGLMTIRRADSIRDLIVTKMQPWLDQMLWSYKDKRMQDDRYLEDTNEVDQRFMNPQWFDDTCINVTVESGIDLGLIATEKIYKPLAFYQPVLVIGQPGVLEFIKSQGFETFDNMFDEQYDREINFKKRLHMILENLNQVRTEPYSDLTWEKLRHNHNLFYDEQLVKQKIITEIIQPLLEYAET
jgi:hypothetical protein